MSDKIEETASLLDEHHDVSAYVIATRDGMVSKYDLATSDPEIFAAMIATAFGAVETSLMEIGQGSPDHIEVKFEGASIFIAGIDDLHLTAFMVANGANGAAEEIINHIHSMS